MSTTFLVVCWQILTLLVMSKYSQNIVKHFVMYIIWKCVSFLKGIFLYGYVFTVKLINVLKDNQDTSICECHTDSNKYWI